MALITTAPIISPPNNHSFPTNQNTLVAAILHSLSTDRLALKRTGPKRHYLCDFSEWCVPINRKMLVDRASDHLIYATERTSIGSWTIVKTCN